MVCLQVGTKGCMYHPRGAGAPVARPLARWRRPGQYGVFRRINVVPDAPAISPISWERMCPRTDPRVGSSYGGPRSRVVCARRCRSARRAQNTGLTTRAAASGAASRANDSYVDSIESRLFIGVTLAGLPCRPRESLVMRRACQRVHDGRLIRRINLTSTGRYLSSGVLPIVAKRPPPHARIGATVRNTATSPARFPIYLNSRP